MCRTCLHAHARLDNRVRGRAGPAALDRRGFVAAGLLGLVGAGFPRESSALPAKPRRYCAIDQSLPVDLKLTSIGRFNGGLLDTFLAPHTDLMEEFFGRRTPILIASGVDNAYYDGSLNGIVLGDTFANAIANESPGLARLAGVIAHERGHEFQVASKFDEILLKDENTVKNVELHADFIAGSYMCWCSRRRRTLGNELSKMFYRLAREDARHIDHHGTHNERWLAFSRGYSDFANVLTADPSAKIDKAALAGWLFIRDSVKSD